MTLFKKILTPLLLIGTLTFFNSNTYANDDSTFVEASVFPNPFSSQLTIKHNKCLDVLQEVAIYDAIGNIIYIFSRDEYSENAMIWEGNSANGSSVNAGTYVCHIRSTEKTESFLIQKQ